MVLADLGLVEQRYEAVLEVLNDGVTVTDLAQRHGIGSPGGDHLASPLWRRGPGLTYGLQRWSRYVPATDAPTSRPASEGCATCIIWVGPRTILNYLIREAPNLSRIENPSIGISSPNAMRVSDKRKMSRPTVGYVQFRKWYRRTQWACSRAFDSPLRIQLKLTLPS